MSSFTTELVVTPLDDGRRWRVDEPFEYWIEEVGRGPRVVVEPGFITDFASVPRLFWNIFPPWGRYGKAAVVHDHLYQTLGLIIEQDGTEKHISRARCDRIFLEAMAVLGVPAWKRWVMWAGVRMGGWLPWRRYQNGHRAGNGPGG